MSLPLVFQHVSVNRWAWAPVSPSMTPKKLGLSLGPSLV